jgi:drug/metabolite transporter (DMT)-like permease
MVMGIIILKKRYNFSKYLAVVLITVGIIVYTISSAKSLKKKNDAKKHVEGETSDLIWMSIGVLLLTIALFTAARMGVYQESLFKVSKIKIIQCFSTLFVATYTCAWVFVNKLFENRFLVSR